MSPTNDERRAFYERSLRDQRHILRAAIEAMGDGDLVQALTIATTIRVFVHETGKSKPLLKNLRSNYLDLRIFNNLLEGPTQHGRTASFTFNLPMGVQISTKEPHVRMMTDIDPKWHLTALGTWWNKPFFNLPAVGPVSRRELILGMANKEAAHVDPEISRKYKLILESQFFQMAINQTNLGPMNISRLLTGRSGVQLLDCLNTTFPES